MRKFILLVGLFLAVGNLFATEGTVTERFSQVDNFKMVSSRDTLNGDLLDWAIRYGRRYTNDLIDGKQATWLNGQKTDSTTYGYLEMNENFEGGIKKIAFCWGHGNENGYTVVLRMFKRGTGAWEDTPVQTWSHTATAKNAWSDSVSYDLALKKNSRIKFDNLSVKTSTGEQPGSTETKGRPLIGDITITPYLKYTQKKCTIPLSNTPYINEALINNTDEGSVTYSLTNNSPAIASIHVATGAVTTLGVGTVTVVATWGEVTTSYDLTITANSRIETFNAAEITNFYCAQPTIKQGDLADWTFKLSGINTGWNGFNNQNAIGIKAPYQNSSDTAYIESSAIAGGLSKLSFLWNLQGKENNITWDIRFIVNGRLVKTLTNAEITATGIMDNPALITIDNINESGKFILRIENHSTTSDSYTSGNKARFTMDNLEFTGYSGNTLTLDEATDNSVKLRANEGEVMNVTLTRSLTANMFNSFCVPFDVNASAMSSAFGSGYQLAEYTNATLSGDQKEVTIHFSYVNAIEAGKPYLIKTKANVVNPSFSNVIIVNTAGEAAGTDMVMQAIINPTHIAPSEHSHLVVTANDSLSWLQEGDESTMKGMRAYLHVVEPAMQTALRRASARMVMNTATEVSQPVEQTTPHVRKVLMNGQLLIVREGKYYTTQGQIVQ